MLADEGIKVRPQGLEERVWDVQTIEARYRKLKTEGIHRKNLDRDEMVAHT